MLTLFIKFLALKKSQVALSSGLFWLHGIRGISETSNSPTPILPPWHSPTLGHRTPSGPRASPPTDVQESLLPHMWPAPWAAPGVFIGWWFSPWSSGGSGLLTLLLPPLRLQTPSAPSVPSPTPPLGTPELSPMVGCELPPLYLSGSGRASQETAISGFYQQVLSSIYNSVWVWWLYTG